MRYITIFLLLVFFFFPTVLALCLPRTVVSLPTWAGLRKAGDEIVLSYLDVKLGKVSSVGLEEYLVGVLAAEMPAVYEIEALKAQAVAARSYILNRMNSANQEHPQAVICTDPAHCKGWLSKEEAEQKWEASEQKKYWVKLKSAVDDTCGEYMIYQDEVVEACFFATSGGKTENSEDVWSTSLPYLRSVESPEDENGKNYRSSAVFTFNEFYSRISPYVKNYAKGAKPSVSEPERTEGGSVAKIVICGKTFKGSEVRSIFGLKSANFGVTVSGDKVTFDVVGYGHGVGMSQTGSNQMAKLGKKYTEILQHYYTNIQIVKM